MPIPSLYRLAIALTLLTAAPPAPAQTTSRPALPFSISKETTFITEPLRPDGTPDYIAALNAQASRGVTPDTNAFVAFLEPFVSPGDSDELARILTLAGGKPSPTAHNLPLFRQYLADKTSLEPAQIAARDDAFSNLTSQLWTAAQYPEVAEYLKDCQAALDQYVLAAQRPQWWVPILPRHGLVDRTSILPLLGKWRYIGQVLSIRTMLRAGTGDADAASRDLLAVKRLGMHLCNSQTSLDSLTGVVLHAQADAALGRWAASGKLTQPQCTALLQALAALPPATDTAAAWQSSERCLALQSMIFVATGQTDAVRNAHLEWLASFPRDDEEKDIEVLAAYESVDTTQVDWNDALKLLNTIDRLVALAQAPDIRELRRQNETLRRTLDQWRMIGRNPNALTNLHQQPAESRAAYTQRIAQAMTGRLLLDADPGKAVELHRCAQMQSQMARTLVAAAAFHARTGKWPNTLADLIPLDLKDIPRDVYSANNAGTEPILYQLTPNGPRVFSVGNNPATPTRDFGIGAPRPNLPTTTSPLPSTPAGLP